MSIFNRNEAKEQIVGLEAQVSELTEQLENAQQELTTAQASLAEGDSATELTAELATARAELVTANETLAEQSAKLESFEGRVEARAQEVVAESVTSPVEEATTEGQASSFNDRYQEARKAGTLSQFLAENAAEVTTQLKQR